MKTMTRLMTSLAAMSLAFTATARADVKYFLNRCSPGAMRACASLMVTTQPNAAGGTDVRISVRNLQGFASGLGDNTGGSLISRIGLVTPQIAGFSSGLTVVSSGAAVVGSPASAWFLRRPGGIGTPIELTAGITPGSRTGGIAGCSAPLGGFPSSYYETCAGGYVDFVFSTTNAWSANSAEVAWLTSDMSAFSGQGVECGSNYAPKQRAYCDEASVTPEPVSMLLVGSGLFGVGGIGFIRRRRGEDPAGV